MEGALVADRAAVVGIVSRAIQCDPDDPSGNPVTDRQHQPRIAETGTSAVQQSAAGTGAIAFAGYPGHAVPLMEKGAPVRWATIEQPAIVRRTWIGAVRGAHPNAALLLVGFLASVEGMKAYCRADDGSMTALDPSGAQTGCQPLAADAHFLSDVPMSDQDSAETLRQLRLQ